MKKYLGKGVYGAVAIGKISVFKKCDAAVTRIHVEDTEKEKQRVKSAKELAANIADEPNMDGTLLDQVEPLTGQVWTNEPRG